MIIAVCPKCGVPIWRGISENIPQEDVKCWICETETPVASCEQHSPTEWREALLDSEKYVQAKNIFHTNMRAVAEKMELPTYLAEWGLLTIEDLEKGEKGDLTKIFQEEIKWLIERIIKRLGQRLSGDTAS